MCDGCIFLVNRGWGSCELRQRLSSLAFWFWRSRSWRGPINHLRAASNAPHGAQSVSLMALAIIPARVREINGCTAVAACAATDEAQWPIFRPCPFDNSYLPPTIRRGHSWCDRLSTERGVDQLANRPNALYNAERHRRRAAECFMRAAGIGGRIRIIFAPRDFVTLEMDLSRK